MIDAVCFRSAGLRAGSFCSDSKCGNRTPEIGIPYRARAALPEKRTGTEAGPTENNPGAAALPPTIRLPLISGLEQSDG